MAADRILSSNINVSVSVVEKGPLLNAWASNIFGTENTVPSFILPFYSGDDIYISKVFIDLLQCACSK
jgi:hypothetical protein